MIRISQLTLENFRSFNELQTIEFAPVTLLFGPNSVGKSTVLLALAYIHNILKNDNCDPEYLEILGNKHVGGFKKMVTGGDLNKTIRIGIELDVSQAIEEEYSTPFCEKDLSFLGLDESALELGMGTAAEKVGIEFFVAYSQQLEIAYIKKTIITADGEFAAEIDASNDKKRTQLTGFYSRIDNWLGAEDIDVHSLDEPNIENLTVLEAVFNNLNPNGPPEDVCPISLSSFNDNQLYSWVGPVGLVCRHLGAIPKRGELLNLNLQEGGGEIDSVDYINHQLIRGALSRYVLRAFDLLEAFLNDAIMIGPLRIVPDSISSFVAMPKQHEWFNGKAAWDKLGRSNYIEIRDISRCISQEDKLNLGYKLVSQVVSAENTYVDTSQDIESVDDIAVMSVASGNEFSFTYSDKPEANERRSASGDKKGIKLPVNMPKESKLYLGRETLFNRKTTLWDIQNNMPVAASDIGVGVSQLLPFVIAAKSMEGGMVSCEQPELHVHPRVQVAIGDILTQQGDFPHDFLIETHSEHIILRILKRIRQTTDGELPKGLAPVKKEDVSIVYLEASESGVKSRRIHIDEDGEFEERWPNGFFAERREELM